ncbi:hypothetical protein [Sideroxyarcus emersonii]|uniref:hypothetical protein n=1 Tax=Sideroxyarcus emersonii TaxID=2764705 RepID=UPI001F1D9104|nr:hypothetical protein [Sideroxyarcus emersonii]
MEDTTDVKTGNAMMAMTTSIIPHRINSVTSSYVRFISHLSALMQYPESHSISGKPSDFNSRWKFPDIARFHFKTGLLVHAEFRHENAPEHTLRGM